MSAEISLAIGDDAETRTRPWDGWAPGSHDQQQP